MKSKFQIYWVEEAKVTGGPKLRTSRMKRYFGASTLLDSSIVVGQSWFSPIGLIKFIVLSWFKKSLYIQNGFYCGNDLESFFRNLLLKYAALAADHVVFQSRFCKLRFDEIFGYLPEKFSIIYNSVPSCSFKVSDIKSRDRDYVVVTGNFRTKQRMNDFLMFCNAWQQSCCDVDLYVFDDVMDGFEDFEFLNFVGKVDFGTIASYLDGARFVVHLKRFDPCPNAVVEALYIGKIVLHHFSGGTPELVLDYGVSFRDFSPFDLREAIEAAFEKAESTPAFSIDTWKEFCGAYESVFTSIS